MIVCPHCGWNNPGEAAFCTNCGRGLGRARTARAGGLEEAVAETRPSDATRKFRALDAAGRTARDHEMPLLRAMIFDGEGAQTPVPAVKTPPPASAPMPSTGAPPAIPSLSELDSLAEAPLPVLRAPAPVADATATLVDFRMPASFLTEVAQAAEGGVPARAALPAPPSGMPGTVEDDDASEPPLLDEGIEDVDAEEFPGLEFGPGAEAAPQQPRDTVRPGEQALIPPVAAPVAVQAGVSEILPLAALDPHSPLRVARVIEALDDEDIEIPSQPGDDAARALDARALLAALPGSAHGPPSAPPMMLDPIDLAELDEVDLDAKPGEPHAGDRAMARLEEQENEDFDDISVSDVEALDPPGPDVHLVESGEMEAVRPDLSRSAPPPLREVRVRFVLRPLSTNVAESRLVSVTDQGLLLGRADGATPIEDDPFVSPQHARLEVDGEALFVEDVGSLNGTWLRVRSQVEILPGDTFRVGHQIMRLDAGPPVPTTRPAADGTRLFGAPVAGGSLHLTQLADGHIARNLYYLPEQGTRIGRHIADIVFTEDTFMSGTHALVLPRGDRAILQDLSSRNGTWVRLVARQPLMVGDAIMVGQTVFRVGKPVT